MESPPRATPKRGDAPVLVNGCRAVCLHCIVYAVLVFNTQAIQINSAWPSLHGYGHRYERPPRPAKNAPEMLTFAAHLNDDVKVELWQETWTFRSVPVVDLGNNGSSERCKQQTYEQKPFYSLRRDHMVQYRSDRRPSTHNVCMYTRLILTRQRQQAMQMPRGKGKPGTDRQRIHQKLGPLKVRDSADLVMTVLNVSEQI